jgi:hypothetical protein
MRHLHLLALVSFATWVAALNPVHVCAAPAVPLNLTQGQIADIGYLLLQKPFEPVRGRKWTGVAPHIG